MEGAFTGKLPEQAEQPASYDAARFYGAAMVDLPEYDPMLWTEDEQSSAEVCVNLFANEYLFDFSAVKAMQRLGVEEGRDATLAKRYMRHWLVQRKIRELVLRFREARIATEGNVLQLMYRDACNFSPLANPMARVAAQKQLAKVLCMEPEDQRKKFLDEEQGAQKNGGVMVVDGVGTLDEWEQKALEEQARLKREVEE
jgi:hypothetical protein